MRLIRAWRDPLAPFNIELNHLRDLITFEPMAVSAKPGPVMVFTELAHSENNRIVNRAADCEFSSYVKMGTSVDYYLQSQGRFHVFAKIDT
ncbi:MAG: hypothetical protein JNK87_19240 [Bryobacterales bacterium]|nr:hypothetical protein [Bryobacterales bacterium]